MDQNVWGLHPAQSIASFESLEHALFVCLSFFVQNTVISGLYCNLHIKRQAEWNRKYKALNFFSTNSMGLQPKKFPVDIRIDIISPLPIAPLSQFPIIFNKQDTRVFKLNSSMLYQKVKEEDKLRISEKNCPKKTCLILIFVKVKLKLWHILQLYSIYVLRICNNSNILFHICVYLSSLNHSFSPGMQWPGPP